MKTAEDEEFERIEREQKIKQVPTFEEKMQKWAENRVRDDLAFAEGFSKGYHKAKQEWVSLTDEDIFGIFGTYRGDPDYNHDQLLLDARRIEAKIKGLNT